MRFRRPSPTPVCRPLLDERDIVPLPINGREHEPHQRINLDDRQRLNDLLRCSFDVVDLTDRIRLVRTA